MCYNIINRDIKRADIEIPIIIPLVVYHNKDDWNIKMTLGEMIPNFNSLPDNLKKYIPDFEYILSDLSNSENEKEVNLEEEHSIIISILNRTRYATKDEIKDSSVASSFARVPGTFAD